MHLQHPSAGATGEFRCDYRFKIAWRELGKTEYEYICIYKLNLFGEDAKTFCQHLSSQQKVNRIWGLRFQMFSFYNDYSTQNPTRGGGRSMPLNDSIDLRDFVEKRALFANHLSCCSVPVCSKSSRKQDGISTECFSWKKKCSIALGSKCLFQVLR